MKIGFDFDKIFIDYPPFVPSRLIDRLYKENDGKELRYRIPKKAEQYIRLFSHYPLFRPLIKQNVLSLKRDDSKKTNTYFLISSRFGFLKNRTELLIQKLNFDTLFEGMYFNYENQQPHLFKREVIDNLALDRYVDDDLPLLIYLSKCFPKIRFYWLGNKEEKIKENLFAIKNISEVFA